MTIKVPFSEIPMAISRTYSTQNVSDQKHDESEYIAMLYVLDVRVPHNKRFRSLE